MSGGAPLALFFLGPSVPAAHFPARAFRAARSAPSRSASRWALARRSARCFAWSASTFWSTASIRRLMPRGGASAFTRAPGSSRVGGSGGVAFPGSRPGARAAGPRRPAGRPPRGPGALARLPRRAPGVTPTRFAPAPTPRSSACAGGRPPGRGSRRHRGKIGARVRTDHAGPAASTRDTAPRSPAPRTLAAALHSGLTRAGYAAALSRGGWFRSSLAPPSAPPDKLPHCVAARVDVKHVKVGGAPVPGKLDFKLHLRLLDGALPHRTRLPDPRAAPQPIPVAIGEPALFDRVAGLLAEHALVWHLAPRGISWERSSHMPRALTPGCVNQGARRRQPESTPIAGRKVSAPRPRYRPKVLDPKP